MFRRMSSSRIFSELSIHSRRLHQPDSRIGRPALIQEIEETLAAADWDYLAQELPLALAQSKDGVQRISSIVFR